MKLDLTYLLSDDSPFVVRTENAFGEDLKLVFTKHTGVEWTKSNLHYRSCMWNGEGQIVSPSFKKFFNWGESPELTYTPFSTKANGGINVLDKVDGSTLIVSRYKGNLIHRTRGTFDASTLKTGWEIPQLIEKYPDAFNLDVDSEGTSDYSLLFEWVTPNNPIVLQYPEPDIILIGKINHKDYTLATQSELDKIGEIIGVKRPNYYHYDSIKQMLTNVKGFEGSEGVCVYCNRDQDIRKIKGEWYLALHRSKSELASIKKVLFFFEKFGYPDFDTFKLNLLDIFDFEIVNSATLHMQLVCEAGWEVDSQFDQAKQFIELELTDDMSKWEKVQKIDALLGMGSDLASKVLLVIDGKNKNKARFVKRLLNMKND